MFKLIIFLFIQLVISADVTNPKIALEVFNQKLKLAQIVINMEIERSRIHLDSKLHSVEKNRRNESPDNPCATKFRAAIAEFAGAFPNAFQQCFPKIKIGSLRFHSFALKQEAVALNLARKSCKFEDDVSGCLAEAERETEEDVIDIMNNLSSAIDDLVVAACDCVVDEKTSILEQVDSVNKELNACEINFLH